MVKETRIVFGLEDLQEVLVRCVNCEGSVSQRPNDPNPVPEECPLCKVSWRGQGRDDIVDVLRSLRRVVAAVSPPVRLQLVLDGEEPDSP